VLLPLTAALTLTAAGGSADQLVAPNLVVRAKWSVLIHFQKVIDVTAPRSDGAVVVATAGRLALFYPPSTVKPFATGPGGYTSPGGGEPYITLSSGQSVPGANCRFPSDAVYALRLVSGPGGSRLIRPDGSATACS
jgi:hypothetical protein